MNADRKKQIAWWAAKVCEQANEYAEIVDPKRQHNHIANKIDAIATLASELHFALTQKLPGVA